MDFEFKHSSGDQYIVSDEQLWNALVSAYGLGMNRGKHLAELCCSSHATARKIHQSFTAQAVR